MQRFLRLQDNYKKGDPRLFDSNFVHAISQNNFFVEDLCQILKVEYVDALQTIMHQPLLEMVNRWQDVLKNGEGTDPRIVCRQLKSSRKLKMPLLFCEILTARETVLKALFKSANPWAR